VKLRLRLAWLFVLGASAAALVLAWQAYAHAKDRAALELHGGTLLATQLRELERVRPVTNEWQGRKRPASGLATRLGETLTGCGIAASSLANVSPQPEMAVQGPPGTESLKRQRASFMLVPITLPQLGSFLDAWRTREPHWTVASIDVAPETGKRDERSQVGGAGGDLPLRVVITLDAVYMDDLERDEPKGDRK
jgi:hypothetical protein